MQAKTNEDTTSLQAYKSEYKDVLGSLIEMWGQYRRHKQRDVLLNFQGKAESFSHNIAASALYPLKSIMSNLNTLAQAGLDETKTSADLIKEVDWLMNQLIRASHEKSDPFLVETDSTQDKIDLLGSNRRLLSDSTPMSKPKIAIIDDQKSIGMALQQSLEDFALEVITYCSIEEFKQVSGADNIDLILLDIVMPNITQEHVFEFAKMQVEKGIKVISCSSKFTFDSRLLAVRAGVIDYVVKPVNTYELVEKIGRSLNLHHHRNYQIVIVDDQETMGTFYKVMLEQVGCEAIFFDSAKALFDVLDDMSPDMFLLDMMMPDVDGVEVAKMIRQEQKFDFAPILFITADEQLESRLTAIDAGADDVIIKSTGVDIINRQVLTRLNRASKMRAFVAKDPLTGVLNHGHIVESANNSLRATKRRNGSACIAVIDVDKFKTVNDEYGHIVGDKVLCALGQLLSCSIRDTDIVGRYGGEEFVIIFEDCNLDDAAIKVNQIKDVFRNMEFTAKSTQFKVSFSAGVAELHRFESIMPAIAAADRALYQAKSTGRNKVLKLKLN